MYQKVKLNSKYEIDTNGVVYNSSTGRAMRGTTITRKNRYVKAHLDKFYLIHKLVMETFVGTCPVGYTIDHIDGNRYNNALNNLEYVTHSTNVIQSRKQLQHRGQYGTDIGTSKLTLEQAQQVHALKDSDLTARQIRDRLKLPVSLTAIKHIRRGKTWKVALSGDIPIAVNPTGELREPLPVHNKIITDKESEVLQANMHRLRQHGGTTGLSIKALLTDLDLNHIASGTAYAHIRNIRLAKK
jgi:hypothetical protein